jgi:hypothetical protein
MGQTHLEPFSYREERQLALLHFFKSSFNLNALIMMGSDKADWSHGVPELRGQTPEACTNLLDRAAKQGLLSGRGGGWYRINSDQEPFFDTLFDKCYLGGAKDGADRAFVEGLCLLANYYYAQYGDNDSDLIVLNGEEGNLLNAREIAKGHKWEELFSRSTKALRRLYRGQQRVGLHDRGEELLHLSQDVLSWKFAAKSGQDTRKWQHKVPNESPDAKAAPTQSGRLAPAAALPEGAFPIAGFDFRQALPAGYIPTGRVAQLFADTTHVVGAPSFAAFCEGWARRSDRTMASAPSRRAG